MHAHAHTDRVLADEQDERLGFNVVVLTKRFTQIESEIAK
jgi:hypothetical protein